MRDERVAHPRLARDLLEPDLVGLRPAEHALGRGEQLLPRLLGRTAAARAPGGLVVSRHCVELNVAHYWHLDNKHLGVIITVTTTNAPPQEATMQPATAIPPDVSTLPAPVRWGRALRALARVMWDPRETDQVLVFSTYANGGSMTRAARFYEDARGEKLFAEDRRLDSRTVDLDALAALPAGTLGHAYATFMRAHGLTPDVFDGAPRGGRTTRAPRTSSSACARRTTCGTS